MQSPEKPAKKHWSVHPWKLAVVVAVVFGFVLPIAMPLMTTTLVTQTLSLVHLAQGLPSSAPPSPDAVTVWTLIGALLVLRLAAGFLATLILLWSQARHALVGRAQNRIGWIALPGFLTALALTLHSLLQLPPSDLSAPYAIVATASILAVPQTTGQVAFMAALLLPVWQQKASRTVGAVILAAVSLIPTLDTPLLLPILGMNELLFPWFLAEPALCLAAALVAAALFEALGRRLWDALALQWALVCLIDKLVELWAQAGGEGAPLLQVDFHYLILWAAPALVALVYLLVRDRQSAKGPPSVAALEITELND